VELTGGYTSHDRRLSNVRGHASREIVFQLRLTRLALELGRTNKHHSLHSVLFANHFFRFLLVYIVPETEAALT